MADALIKPLIFVALLLPAVTHPAEVPARDTVVETQLLPPAVKRSLRALRPAPVAAASAPERQPHNAMRSFAAAQRLIETGRASGDPRTLGYAEAMLAPWPATSANTPLDALVLHATIAQSRHDFATARALLGRVLMRAPDHAQARLTRATVAQVNGDYAAARADCAQLQAQAPAAAAICSAAIDAATGADARALQTLQHVIGQGGPLRGWALATLADVHAQRGEWGAAARAYAGALQSGDDPNLRASFADVLLAQGEAGQALALLRGAPPTDGVLLRRWLALRASSDDAAASEIAGLREQLAARIAAASARGELLHVREAAWFALEDGRAAEALALARANWSTQREATDLWLLARAAHATADAGSLAQVREWLQSTQLNDARLKALMKERS